MNTRYHRLDSIRGIVLISMIAYHTVWDLVNVSGFKWDWYDSTAAFIWQQSICWSFILLSGFCWSLGRHHLRRGLTVLAASALVSCVTLAVMPDEGIIFGVLTLIGVSMLLLIPLDKLAGLAGYASQKMISGTIASRQQKGRDIALSAAGAAVCFFLFLICKNAKSGAIGIGGAFRVSLPKGLYLNYFTAFLGFPMKGFYSSDYFPLIPWVFLFFCGYFIYRVFAACGFLGIFSGRGKEGPLKLMGRHSLLIYLLHQPVIYAVSLFVKMLSDLT